MDYYQLYKKYKSKYLQVSGKACSSYRKTKDPNCKDQDGCHWVVGTGCREKKKETPSQTSSQTSSQKPPSTKMTKQGRLSAGEYYRNHGNDISIGDRCNIRKDGEYKCLLKRNNGVPYWASPSKSGKGQESCEDWSSKCQEPNFQ